MSIYRTERERNDCGNEQSRKWCLFTLDCVNCNFTEPVYVCVSLCVFIKGFLINFLISKLTSFENFKLNHIYAVYSVCSAMHCNLWFEWNCATIALCHTIAHGIANPFRECVRLFMCMCVCVCLIKLVTVGLCEPYSSIVLSMHTSVFLFKMYPL